MDGVMLFILNNKFIYNKYRINMSLTSNTKSYNILKYIKKQNDMPFVDLTSFNNKPLKIKKEKKVYNPADIKYNIKTIESFIENKNKSLKSLYK